MGTVYLYHGLPSQRRPVWTTASLTAQDEPREYLYHIMPLPSFDPPSRNHAPPDRDARALSLAPSSPPTPLLAPKAETKSNPPSPFTVSSSASDYLPLDCGTLVFKFEEDETFAGVATNGSVQRQRRRSADELPRDFERRQYSCSLCGKLFARCAPSFLHRLRVHGWTSC